MLYLKSIRLGVVQGGCAGGCAAGVVQDRMGLCKGLCKRTWLEENVNFFNISSMSGLCKLVNVMFPHLQGVVQGCAGGVPRMLLDRTLFRLNIVSVYLFCPFTSCLVYCIVFLKSFLRLLIHHIVELPFLPYVACLLLFDFVFSRSLHSSFGLALFG